MIFTARPGLFTRHPRACFHLAKGPYGHMAMTIWARTEAGRPLIVVVRRLATWDWQILGVRDLRPGELHEFEAWEAR